MKTDKKPNIGISANIYPYQFFLLGLSFLMPFFCMAQVTNDIPDESKLSVITINLDNGSISSVFPFDKRFKIKVVSSKYQLKSNAYVFPMTYRKGKKRAKNNMIVDTLFYERDETQANLLNTKKGLVYNLTLTCDDYATSKEKMKCKSQGKKLSNKIRILEEIKKPYIEYKQKNYKTYDKAISILSTESLYLPVVRNIDHESKLDFYKKYYKVVLDSIRLEHGNAELKITEKAITRIKDVEQESIKLRKDKKNEYSAIIPELSPNRLYDLVFVRLPTEKEINSLYQIVHLFPDADKARLKYMKEIEKSELEQNNTEIKKFSESFDNFSLQTYPRIIENIKILENRILSLITDKKRNEPNFFSGWDDQRASSVGNKIKDSKLRLENYSIVTNSFLSVLGSSGVPNTSQTENFFNGLRSVEKEKDIDKHEYKKRYNALKSTASHLDTLLVEIKKLNVSHNSPDVEYVFTRVQNTKLFLDSILAEYKKFDSYLQNIMNERISIALPVSTSTSSPEIKTRNSQVIITDFGFLVASAYNAQGETVIIPRPTVGFNLHFGGIDKNQEMSHILNPKLRHHWSLSLGVTVGKIENGTYSDLFNGISPYLGVNYRIDEQIRIGGGVLFINDSDPNPILDDKIFDPAPYLMVSFDFENLFSKLGKLATKIVN